MEDKAEFGTRWDISFGQIRQDCRAQIASPSSPAVIRLENEFSTEYPDCIEFLLPQGSARVANATAAGARRSQEDSLPTVPDAKPQAGYGFVSGPRTLRIDIAG